MALSDETHDETLRGPRALASPEPGVLIVFAAGRPASEAIALGSGGALVLGRGTPGPTLEDDERVSRAHVRVSREALGFRVEDLGSRNGVHVNGQRISASELAPAPALVRIGRSLFACLDDVTPFLGQRVLVPNESGAIIGGRLRRAYGEIALASRAGDTLLLRGESGSGKELAARAFHEAHYARDPKRPFVAVNCAAIPEGLAERLLFGTRRGAYSGAVQDAEGYIEAAHTGTLFLDEIAELDPLVQAKLLRVLESREVLALGASKPRKVELRVCAASHASLRDEVAAGRFREDLYFRIGRPEVVLPPLRERLDEIPWLIARELSAADPGLSASVSLIEAVSLRAWPGNVRELLAEIRRAAQTALAAGACSVEAEHLAADAGIAFARAAVASEQPAPRAPATALPSDAEIEKALAEHGGNVRGTARALGMHRNQLRRWLERRDARPKDAAGAERDEA